jgi:peptidoglycan/LPS O-acetylase OafA/YrhL
MKDRQPELDYLRGVACLMVVFFHYLVRGPKVGWTGDAHFPWAESVAMYGHYGVQLFFMISGFVIYKSATGRSVDDFAKARFWRLYPAYWIAILLTSAFVLVAGERRFQVSFQDFLWNFTMFQGWAKASNVDGAYWSLQVELLFYLYVALAIKFRLVSRTVLIVSVWLLICTLNAVLRFTLIDSVFLAQWGAYFAIGIICFRLREGDQSPVLKFLLVWAILIACFRTYVDLGEALKPMGAIDVLLVFALSALFVYCVYRRREVKSSIYSKFFGELTYPVYLLHQFIGYILLSAFVAHLGSNLSLICVVLLVLVMSYGVNQLFEKRLTGYVRLRFA